MVGSVRYFILLASRITLPLLLLLLLTGKLEILPCYALRMINLDVPQMAIQGDTIQLSCSYSLADGRPQNSGEVRTLYDLDGDGGERGKGDGGGNHSSVVTDRRRASSVQMSIDDRLSSSSSSRKDGASYKLTASSHQSSPTELLYAIKWYKDEGEFFRFVAQDYPHKQILPVDGLNIDADKSDNQTVVLRNVSLKTSGSFRCEVSTDAPSFLTKSIERKVLVYSLPTEGPSISLTSRTPWSRQAHHYLGDQLEFTCLSHESKPPVQLDWIVNGQFNLTDMMPRNSEGQPIFQIGNKRLVRVPTLQPPPQAGVESLGDSRNSLNLETGDVNRASYETYALEQTATDDNQVIVKSIDTSRPTQKVSLNVDSIDQLLEITMSTLNFSVNIDLIRLVLRLGGEPTQRTVDSIWRTRKAYVQADQLKHFNSTSQGASISAAIDGGQKRSTSKRFLPFRLKCVARVMHLRMSDDIMLNLVNKTREATSALDTPSMKPRRRERVGTNSSGGYGQEFFRYWLITLVSCVLIKSLLLQ